jgi:hypothetical protein
MANVPSNFSAAIISGSASITGSFAGFTTLTAGAFTGLKDGNGGNLVSNGNSIAFSAGANVPLTVTSASISSGVVLLYP